MFSRIASLVLVVALVITGFWGYREHQQKQALLLKSENQYQRAFHDLSVNMNMLQDQLGKSLAVNSKKELSNNLAQAWRLSTQAHGDVGQLPLTLLPFNNTASFLTDISNFSYRVSVRPETKQALTDSEWNTLHDLYNRSKGLETQLNDLQTKVITQNLRWTDAEQAMSDTEKKTDNQIVDGFRSMDKSVQGQKPINFGPTILAVKTRNKPDPANLSGTDVNQTQAAQIVQKWLGLPNTNGIVVHRNGSGNNYPSYSIVVNRPSGAQEFIRMTIKGGHITSYMNQRYIEPEKIDLAQGEQKALQYLKAHGIQGQQVVKTDTYDNGAIYEIVPIQDGALIYPDKMVVKVALDNGDVVGLNTQDYMFHHKPRQLPKPKLTEAQAVKFVSPRVKVQETHLSLVQNDINQEVLCYEFIGTMDNDTYKVYISSINGDEVGVEKM